MSFSDSGVTTSVPVPGGRLSVGPRGTYISGGRGMVHWRHRIGARTQQPTAPVALALDVRGLGTEADQQAVTLLNARSAHLAWLPRVVRWGVIAVAIAVWAQATAIAHSSPALSGDLGSATIALFALAWFAPSIVRPLIAPQRRVKREYNLATAPKRYGASNQACQALARTQRLWLEMTHTRNPDPKYDGAATCVVTRTNARLAREALPHLECNVTPWVMTAGKLKVGFLPDRLYIWDGTCYGAVSYQDMSVAIQQNSFREQGAVPSDAVVVGQVWLHGNRDGSPDRRFARNHQIPVLLYGDITLTLGTGASLTLEASSYQAALDFVTTIGGKQQ